MFKFFRSAEDIEMARRLDRARKNGYKSMNVVGRGTLVMDAKELSNNPRMKEARQKASELVTD